MNIARDMNLIVTPWLVHRGALPPFAAKALPAWQRQTEERLAEKMSDLFSDAFSSLFTEMRKRQFTASRTEQQALVDRFLSDPTAAAPEVIWPEAQLSAGFGRQDIQQALRRAGIKLDFTPLPKTAEEYLREQVFRAGEETMARLRGDVGDVMSTIADAVREGLGVDDAASRLRQVFDGLDEYRLGTIARTEVHTAQAYGNNDAMRQYDVEYKQWISTNDDHVRTSHMDLHAVVIRRSEVYPNGLEYPGQRGGPPGEVINCRCRQRPYIPRRGEIISSTPYWP